MCCKNISWLIFIYTAVTLASCYRNTDSTTEWSVTESVREARQEAGLELGALLDAGADAVVTLEAGSTQLVAHRTVLATRSPVLESMLRHYSGRLSLPGVEGPVLRHLLAYLYTLRAPRLLPGAATQLLAAAHRLGLPALQADCERQVAAQLSVETAASAAVLAVELSVNHLRDAAINFIKDHRVKVLATKGWADALENRPKEVAEVSRLLADRLAEICAPTTMGAGTATTTEAATIASMETEVTTEAGTTTSTKPHSHPATAAPQVADCPTSPLGEATVSPPCEPAPAASGTTPASQWHSDVTGRGPTATVVDCSAPPPNTTAVSRLASLSENRRNDMLSMAALKGSVQDIWDLVAAGADVTAWDSDSQMTALHWAAVKGHVEAVRCLLQAGAQVYARNKYGATPLHAAVENGHAAVVALLLAAGADANAKTRHGLTPLHRAAGRGDADVVRALLEAGADKAAKTWSNDTPLGFARFHGHHHLKELLA